MGGNCWGKVGLGGINGGGKRRSYYGGGMGMEG